MNMNKLNHYRKLAGLSTRQLAKLSNLSASTVSAYGRGLHNAYETKRALFDGLKTIFENLTFQELWEENEKATAKTVASVEAIGDKDGQRLSTTSSLSFIESKKSNTLTMSSREIAKLLETRHADVIRTIERLMDRGVVREYPPLAYTVEQNGQKYKEYKLEKRDSFVVVAQLSPEFTAKVVDRWQELEGKVSKQAVALPTPTELAMLVIKAEEEKKQLLLQNKEKDEKIELLNNKFISGQTAPDFCKGLNGINVNKINQFLVGYGWIFDTKASAKRREYRVTSYARDLFMTEEVLEITILGGNKIIKHKPVLTKKGAIKLMELYTSGKLNSLMKKGWNGLYYHCKQLGEVA